MNLASRKQKVKHKNQGSTAGDVGDTPGPRSWGDAIGIVWPKRRFWQVVFILLFGLVAGSYALFKVLPDSVKNSLLNRLSLARPFSNKRASIAFLAGEFVLDLEHPYERKSLTRVDVQVAVTEGSVIPLREAELLSFEYDHSRFDDAALGQVQLVIITPSAPRFSAGHPSGVISLDFSSSGLIPLGDFTSTFRRGDRQPFGKAVVRIWFSDGEKKRYNDVSIPLVFTKQSG